VSRYIFDTDHVTLHQHGHSTIVQRLLRLEDDDIAVTIITVEEQIRGRLDIVRRYNASPRQIEAYAMLQATLRYFQRLLILDFSQAAYDHFIALRRQRICIGSQDLRIAAITLAADGILVTRNHRDFAQIPDLSLEDWSIP
jgi:tRNA(fMet)-specific endonuclease VapC